MCDECQILWAAGLYEGEGWCHASSPRNIAIQMTDLEPLERFMNVVQRGSIYGPYQHAGRKTPIYRWQIMNHEGRRHVHALLYPHLSQRRQRQLDKLHESDKKLRRHLFIGGSCRHGHTITPETLALRPKKGGVIDRVCRVCAREVSLRSYHKHKRLKNPPSGDA